MGGRPRGCAVWTACRGACPSVGASPTISARSASAVVAAVASTSAVVGAALASRRQMSSSTCASSAARSSSARCASHAASGAAAPAPGCVVAESTRVMLRSSLICCAISSSAVITPASSGRRDDGCAHGVGAARAVPGVARLRLWVRLNVARVEVSLLGAAEVEPAGRLVAHGFAPAARRVRRFCDPVERVAARREAHHEPRASAVGVGVVRDGQEDDA